MLPPFNSGLSAMASMDKGRSLLFKGGHYLIYKHIREKSASGAAIPDERGDLATIKGWPANWKEVHAGPGGTKTR